MRCVRKTGLLLAILAVTFAGCLDPWLKSDESQPISRSSPLRTTPAETLFIETVLIEQPIGEGFLNSELWKASPAAVSPERKALLAENGLRAVIVSGNPPTRFVEMITSDLATVNPQILTFSVRKEEVVATNGPVDASQFSVLTDFSSERVAVTVKHANFGWRVQPEATADGRVKLTCEPQLQHGDRQEWLRPSADGTQFTMKGEMPMERYSSLGFETTLGPRDFLVIGGMVDQTERLGEAFFRVNAGGQTRQRVLVIRAYPGSESEEDFTKGPKPRGGPAIALEAARGRAMQP